MAMEIKKVKMPMLTLEQIKGVSENYRRWGYSTASGHDLESSLCYKMGELIGVFSRAGLIGSTQDFAFHPKQDQSTLCRSPAVYQAEDGMFYVADNGDVIEWDRSQFYDHR